MKTIAIIPAGGKGKRSGHSTPKQYLRFNNKEMIVFTLETFQRNKLINEIVVACDPYYFKLLKRIKEKYHLTKLLSFVEGGKERQHSVFNALSSIYAGKNDLIVVHDAVRPLLPDNILTASIQYARKKGNALVCLKARDTLIKGNEAVKKYLNREQVFYVQTPQVFTYSDLMTAMQNAKKKKFIGTDESTLVKKIGKKVNIIEGSPLNFKITTKEDIILFKKIINNG